MKVYQRALSYFLYDWPRILGLVALIILIVLLGTLLAWPMAILLDVVLTHTPRTGFIYRCFQASVPQSTVARVIVLAGAFIGIKFTLDLLSCLRSMLNNSIKYRGTVRVRGKLFRRFQELGKPYHDAHPMGDAIFRLSNDTFGPFGIFDTIFSTGQHMATLVAVATIMFTRSVPLTLFALSLAPLMLVGARHFGRTIKHRADKSRASDSNLMTVIQRAMSTINLIHAYDRQAHEESRFDAAMDQSVRAAMSMHWQENLYPLFIQTIYGIGQASVLGYGGYLVYRDQIVRGASDGLSYGDLVLFMGYFCQLLSPLSEVIGFSARVKTSIAASERVFAILDCEPEIKDAPHAIELPLKPRPIALKNVSFGHTPESSIIQEVSARIEPGEMVAFVGPSGCGKSTLLNLLPRFHDPVAGQIKLGGRDLRGIKISSVRRHIVMVSQENGLLAGSIAENIAYGNANATPEEIVRAAELAGAAEFIAALPEGYDTLVAEGGKNFSGGQRQRLAIARALLTDAPILIFDEPTSALDTHTEQLVLNTLYSLKGKRTIILVTHRLESVSNCDRIYILQNGGIVEHIDGRISAQCNVIEPTFLTSLPTSGLATE